MQEMMQILKRMESEYETMVKEQSEAWAEPHTVSMEYELMDQDHFLEGYSAALLTLEQHITEAALMHKDNA